MIRPTWITMIQALSRYVRSIVLVVGFACAAGVPAARAAYPLKIYRGKPGQQIPGLRIFARPELSEKIEGQDIEQYLVISGIYPSRENSLIGGRTALKRNKKGQFKIKLKLTGPKKIVLLTSVAPDGTVHMERITILYPGYHPKKVARWGVSGGIGLSYIEYSQSPTDDIRSVSLGEMGITGKISYEYHIVPKRWDFGLSMYATALVPYARLNEEYDPQAGETAPTGYLRFLGVNARIGYTVPWVSGTWALTLMGGVYYTTTFCTVTPSYPFGFQNLMGPQLFPVLRKALANGNSLSTYLKYSPVSSGGFGIYALDSRELAAGLTYSIRHGQHFIPISLDLANLQTNISETVTSLATGSAVQESTHINTSSFTLSVGYTL